MVSMLYGTVFIPLSVEPITHESSRMPPWAHSDTSTATGPLAVFLCASDKPHALGLALMASQFSLSLPSVETRKSTAQSPVASSYSALYTSPRGTDWMRMESRPWLSSNGMGFLRICSVMVRHLGRVSSYFCWSLAGSPTNVWKSRSTPLAISPRVLCISARSLTHANERKCFVPQRD